MRVLVTGGAGFIGGNLCRMLQSNAGVSEVVVLDNLSNGAESNLGSTDSLFIEGDIRDPDTIDKAMDNVDAVVHLAALGSVPRSVENPLATHDNNATGTLQVLEGARRAGGIHTIVASSSSVYGANKTLPKNEDLSTQPMSPYGASKLASEWYALSYQHSMDLPVLAFRFFNVFGPLQSAEHVYAAAIPRFLKAAIAGVPVTVHGDGLQTRDFTYVDTVCSTISRAISDRVTCERPVNLAFGQPLSILDVIAAIGELLGTEVAVDHVDPRPGDVRHSDADSSLLYELFPGTAPTPFIEGLQSTLDWFKSLE